MLKNWFKRIKYRWNHPYGVCPKHHENETKHYGCLSCYAEMIESKEKKDKDIEYNIAIEDCIKKLRDHVGFSEEIIEAQIRVLSALKKS